MSSSRWNFRFTLVVILLACIGVGLGVAESMRGRRNVQDVDAYVERLSNGIKDIEQATAQGGEQSTKKIQALIQSIEKDGIARSDQINILIEELKQSRLEDRQTIRRLETEINEFRSGIPKADKGEE